MGEVRVQVKLVNLADLTLAATGKLGRESVRTVVASAMVDTGAVRSCIPQPLLDRLGIQPMDHMMVEFANGQKESVNPDVAVNKLKGV